MQLAFDCVFYYTADLPRAVRFYRDILGFKLLSQDAVARFDIDGVLFEIVPITDSVPTAGHGNARLCLRTDDIKIASEELRTKGVEVSAVEKKSNGLLAGVKDPDGNEICLWQYT